MAADCPICLDEMDPSDSQYPLLCPTKCGYNFCTKCIDHLVASSKCGYEEASDGSRQVKVKLICPQCRGDLSNTIKDTLLMRQAYKASKYKDIPDSELNATELRIKHEFSVEDAQAVRDAEARLRKFHEMDTQALDVQPSLSADGHEVTDKNEFIVDTSLFNGLEYAMSEAEQVYVAKLMISGDADLLAQAAEIINSISQIALQGTTPSMKNAAAKQPPTMTARERAHEKVKLEELARERKNNPLPARMPRYGTITAFKTNRRKSTMIFMDDEWDGSIADAFSRMHTTQKSVGMQKIVSLADDPYMATVSTPRVKIRSVRGEAGRLGLQPGDVVTHINGEKFNGNTDALDQHIQNMYYENPENPPTFTIVVNAEPSTAQVLKLRAQLLGGAKVERL